ncbi:hypothetical protein F7725_009369 [Dissostichus mawsoni]|uniref:Uncharacterized protein n=1 Tax=Dissostichus mawsoni TaxID=36200 RepID=A0A7J5Z7D8_DISMA|nr:hypothetical protein F7725_009369 [Dissostichus mawsoni]
MDWRSLPSSGDTHQRIVGLAAKRLGMGPPVVGCCHGDGAGVQCINLIGISHNPNWNAVALRESRPTMLFFGRGCFNTNELKKTPVEGEWGGRRGRKRRREMEADGSGRVNNSPRSSVQGAPAPRRAPGLWELKPTRLAGTKGSPPLPPRPLPQPLLPPAHLLTKGATGP